MLKQSRVEPHSYMDIYVHGIQVAKIHQAACGGSYKIVKNHLCQVAGHSHTCTGAYDTGAFILEKRTGIT